MTPPLGTQLAGDTLEGGATIAWDGDLEQGQGTVRFELGAGDELPLIWPGSERNRSGATSPEELAAAAHAACFTMTLAHALARAQHPPRRITTNAKATFGVAERQRSIVRSRLDVAVEAAGLDQGELERAVELAAGFCPVSNTLRAAGVELLVEARLTG